MRTLRTFLSLTLALAALGCLEAGETPSPKLAADLNAYLDDLAQKGEFSGVVLLTRGSETLFSNAYGLADRERNIPNRIDTKFNLASMNKMFTGVAIAQLAEKGKLSFDDKVGKHLPDYPNREVAEKVTIHHLLTHTSGLGSYWNPRYQAAKDRLLLNTCPTPVPDHPPVQKRRPLVGHAQDGASLCFQTDSSARARASRLPATQAIQPAQRAGRTEPRDEAVGRFPGQRHNRPNAA